MADDIAHAHDWGRSKRFIDFCHYTVVERTCKECGVVNESAVERDFDLNPLQIVFARVDCKRCRELCRGIEPASWGETTYG